MSYAYLVRRNRSQWISNALGHANAPVHTYFCVYILYIPDDINARLTFAGFLGTTFMFAS